MSSPLELKPACAPKWLGRSRRFQQAEASVGQLYWPKQMLMIFREALVISGPSRPVEELGRALP